MLHSVTACTIYGTCSASGLAKKGEMAALFGNTSGNSRREPRSLLEFRAGKMKLNGTTVSADTRKGLVYVKMEDSLLHFCWKDRKTGEVVDDFIVFPGDAELKRVAQCTTGRVVLLKFKDTSRKFFYWLQEPKDDKDEEYLKKVNDLIEHPPDPSQVEAMLSGGQSGFPAGLGGLQLQSLLGGAAANPQMLEQLLSSGVPPPGILPLDALSGRGLSALQQLSSGGRGQQQGSSSSHPSSSTASAPPQPNQSQQQSVSSRGHRGQAVQLGDLQNILSSMNIPAATEPQEKPEEAIGLNDVVTSDVLRPLSSDSSVQEQLQPHIPPTSETVADVLTSPQFQQALGVFGSALQSGQLGPLISQFGMGQDVINAANTGNLQQFASALQNEQGEGSSQSVDRDKDAGKKADSEDRKPDKDEQGTA